MNYGTALLLLQEEPTAGQTAAAAGVGLGLVIVTLAIAVFLIAAMWKVFEKAGKPGWAAIIPIYNIVVLLEIAGKPLWWIVLFLIPFVNFVVAILLGIAVARSFGKGTGFGLGLTFLGFVFYPVLAWGDARYQGPQQA